MRYQFVMSVWGKRYLDLFSSLALPSLMTSGNLLGFSPYDCEFDIYTTVESKQSLDGMAILTALAAFMKIRVTTVPGDDMTDEKKYVRMNYAHGLATVRSAQTDSVLFFLAPDAIFSDGTLACARRLLEKGKRVVLLAGARAAAVPFVADLKEHFTPNESFGLEVSPRQLASLQIRHPHDCYYTGIWGNRPFTVAPAHVFFPVADEGYILRAFFQHPIAVYPSYRNQVAKSTVDGRWLVDAVPDREDWYLITDTDDACVIDVGTQADECIAATDHEDPEQYVADWMAAFSDVGHHWMVKQNVYVHNGYRSHRWAAAERRATLTFDRIFALYNRPVRLVLALAKEFERRGAVPLALFGAVALADRILDEITSAGCQIAGIFDSDEDKHGRPFGLLAIQSPNCIQQVNASAIIILVRQSQAQVEIRRTIEATGYAGRIICWSDL